MRGVASPMVIVYGFIALAAIGTGFLLLPVANTTGEVTPFLTAVFTSVSAITVTGLIVVDTPSYWTGFGEAVILVLLFIGGLGFMTSAAFLLILIWQRLGLHAQR